MARNRVPRAVARTPVRPHPPASGLPVPPLLRDPWALLVALCVLPVLFSARATPLGEPFADDFLFLDFSFLRGNPSWWDGGGGVAYWRPLARQAYYGVLGPLMLAHPAVLAALHALALAAAGVLLLRALRRAWPAPAAAAAAAFPLLLESARTLLAWPSGAQDLGSLLFLALALHAAARGRVALLAAAAVAAALCKEVAAPLALLAACAPFPVPRGTAGRWRAPFVTGAALSAWAVVRFALPHFGAGAALLPLANPLAATLPLPARLAQAIALAAGDAFSLSRMPAWVAGVAIGAALLPALAVFAIGPVRGEDPTRTGVGGAGGASIQWLAWGVAWFVAGAAPLALFLPDWASFRSVLPAAGLGVALVAPLAFASGAWLVPLAAVRLAALLFAAQPPAWLSLDTSSAGDALSFPRLAQLQRTVRGVRSTLHALAPALAPRSRVLREGWPRMTGVAFAGDLSLHVWYRDTTLTWTGRESLEGADSLPPAAMVEFEPHRQPQFSAVDGRTLREVLVAQLDARDRRWDEALARYSRAEAMLPDTSAALLRANLAGWRAGCLYESGRVDEAAEQAGIAMGRYPDTRLGRFTLAQVLLTRGDWPGAARLLEEHLQRYPEDEDAQRFLAEARRRMR